jgi:hypothetical protein
MQRRQAYEHALDPALARGSFMMKLEPYQAHPCKMSICVFIFYERTELPHLSKPALPNLDLV